MPQAFKSGVGRLVWGRPGVFSPVTDDDNKPVLDEQGQQVTDNSFGVAFPKAEFGQFLWPMMLAAAAEDFPAVAQQGMAGAPQDYAWKFVDGDANTGHKKGKPYNEREGYPGCFVMAFTTRLPNVSYWKPSMVTPGAWDQILHTEIKTGDYVSVSGMFVSHKAKNARSKPGLYTNPQGVLLIGVGQAILNSPDAATMFGGMQYQLPPGATAPGAAPAMPMGGQPPGMQQYAPIQGGYAPVPQPQPAPMQQQPQPQYQPAYDIIPGGQPPQPAPGPAPVYQQPQYQPAYDIIPGGQPPQPVQQYLVQPGLPPQPQVYVQPAPAAAPQPGQMPPGFPPQR